MRAKACLCSHQVVPAYADLASHLCGSYGLGMAECVSAVLAGRGDPAAAVGAICSGLYRGLGAEEEGAAEGTLEEMESEVGRCKFT
jgi:hypothetical protein